MVFSNVVCNQPKNGANALGLQRVLGLGSYQTAWTWLQKLRRTMVRPLRDRLHGNVEVDESFVGGISSGGKRGRGAENKEIVVIAVEIHEPKGFGRIRMKRIDEQEKTYYSQYIAGDKEEKRDILRKATSNRSVDGKNVAVELRWPFEGVAEIVYSYCCLQQRGTNRTLGKDVHDKDKAKKCAEDIYRILKEHQNR